MSWLAGANPKLVITTSSLKVTNWFRQYSIPWQAVHWIQQTDEVVIHLGDGGKIKPAVAGGHCPVLVGRYLAHWRANPR